MLPVCHVVKFIRNTSDSKHIVGVCVCVSFK